MRLIYRNSAQPEFAYPFMSASRTKTRRFIFMVNVQACSAIKLIQIKVRFSGLQDRSSKQYGLNACNGSRCFPIEARASCLEGLI